MHCILPFPRSVKKSWYITCNSYVCKNNYQPLRHSCQLHPFSDYNHGYQLASGSLRRLCLLTFTESALCIVENIYISFLSWYRTASMFSFLRKANWPLWRFSCLKEVGSFNLFFLAVPAAQILFS